MIGLPAEARLGPFPKTGAPTNSQSGKSRGVFRFGLCRWLLDNRPRATPPFRVDTTLRTGLFCEHVGARAKHTLAELRSIRYCGSAMMMTHSAHRTFFLVQTKGSALSLYALT